MDYSKPDLRNLKSPSVSGDEQGCVPGSAAGGITECTVGQGDDFGLCTDGGGASKIGCSVGTGDTGFIACVPNGNAPGQFCVAGGAP